MKKASDGVFTPSEAFRPVRVWRALEAEHYVKPTLLVASVVSVDPRRMTMVNLDYFPVMTDYRSRNPHSKGSCLIPGGVPDLIVMTSTNNHIVMVPVAIITMFYNGRVPDIVIMPCLNEYSLVTRFVMPSSVPISANNGSPVLGAASNDDLFISAVCCAGITHTAEEQSASGQEG